MSRSPKDFRTKGDAEGYSAAWGAIYKLVREGHSWSGHERNVAFLNCSTAAPQSKTRNQKSKISFSNISAVSGLDFADDGRAMSLVDWDHDGDLDIWLHNRTGPRLRLMINRTITPGAAEAPRSVALRLRGTKSNRDAIGARVELLLAEALRKNQKSIQTLHAGNGFMSQSSKWLHFGLGAASRIRAVRVRWPGGATESFTGLRPGRRYVLEEGSGIAVEWARPPAAGGLRLEGSTQKPHESTSSAHVLLPERVVLPVLRYALSDGSPRRIDPRGDPLLVNLWASWCLPCIAELKGFTENEETLRGAGLSVLALSVDGLDEAAPTDQAGARRLLERIEYPFVSGAATAELLDKVDLMIRFVFDHHPDFAVPMSLLLDPQGRLAAIYRGPVDVERLLRDVAALKLPTADLRRLAAPMPGRRHGFTGALRLDDLASRFSGRYDEDHLRFLRLAVDEVEALQRRYDAMQLPEAQLQWLTILRSEAHYKLAVALNRRGRLDEAISRFRVAIRVRSDYADASYNLAKLLERRGDTEEAMAHYRRAVEIAPNHTLADYNLANLLRTSGRVDDAVRHYGRALEIDPAHVLAHNNLALALRSQGRIDEAMKHLREAIGIDPQYAPAHHNLAYSLELQGRIDEAVVHYRRALSIAPDTPIVLRGLAAALAARGDVEEARVHLARGLELVTAAGHEDAARAIRAQLKELD